MVLSKRQLPNCVYCAIWCYSTEVSTLCFRQEAYGSPACIGRSSVVVN